MNTDDKPVRDDERSVVLELRDVCTISREPGDAWFDEANFTLHDSEIAIVDMGSAEDSRNIASMLQGIVYPSRGQVAFEGADWLGDDFDRHFRMRSRIGRVFQDQAWIENFNVRENVTLASLHHGRDRRWVDNEILLWAERLKVEPPPKVRPAFLDPAKLQLYQWLRALLGSPALLILESPLRSVAESSASVLVGALSDLCSQGTAVLWLTRSASRDSENFTTAPSEFRLRNGRLTLADDGSRP